MKRTIVDQVTVSPLGHIQIRFKLEEDGVVTYLRTSLQPGSPLDLLLSEMDRNLVKNGWPTIALSDIALLQTRVAIEHTPEVVAAFQAAAMSSVGTPKQWWQK